MLNWGESTAGRRIPVGLAWGLAAVAIWSGSFVLLRLGVTTTLNAFDITALRFACGAVLLLPVILRRGFARKRLGLLGLLVLIAGTGAPYALLISLGLSLAPAGNAAALVPGLMPVFSAALGVVLLREDLPPARRWGAGLVLAGTLLIGGFARTASLAYLAFAAAALLWAGYVIVLRRSNLSALHATAIVAVGSAMLYLPIYGLLLPKAIGTAPKADLMVQALYQGGLTTVAGLAAFSRAVTLLGTAGAALPALVPVVTLAFATTLGEIPSAFQVSAALIIGGGVALITSAKTTIRSAS